ncbi:hypothetical protein [Gallaecimonas mangrovi]|uniref:hypothetical protein n=1 Tax=Gallaecimonas mangrovi TaxID=2291597 RepID=UPI000E20B76B|nr:hypothetical protein [Gallaecimonas mangrovi]
MNVFVFILCVVIVATLGRLARAWVARQPSQPDPKLTQELAELKSRVAALERIVTDSEYQLKKDFEKL